MLCLQCGQSFESSSTGRPAKFCSHRCRQAHFREKGVTKPCNETPEQPAFVPNERDETRDDTDLLLELPQAAGIKQKSGELARTFFKRPATILNRVDDAAWDALSQNAKDWAKPLRDGSLSNNHPHRRSTDDLYYSSQ